MGEDRELLELIKKRDYLRKQEKSMTAEIKRLRKKMSEVKRKLKGNIQSRPLIVEARQKVIAVRVSCRKALRKAGYNSKQISEIIGVSYQTLLENEQRLISEAERLNRIDSNSKEK
jgi:ribosomal protein L28